MSKGIREMALSHEEEKEIGITNYSNKSWEKESKSLFGETDIDYERPYHPAPAINDSPAFSDLKSNQVRIEIDISLEELGNIADPDAKEYNNIKMIQEAEDLAEEILKNKLGKEIEKNYTIEVEGVESIDVVQVFLLLTPLKTNAKTNLQEKKTKTWKT